MGERAAKFRGGAAAWGRRWLANLPAVGVGAAMFFLCMALGGSRLSSLGIPLMMMGRSYATARIPASAWLHQGLVILLAALLGMCATFSYPLCVALNALVMFAIVFYCGNELLPKTYFAPGFAFIMMQMYRHTPGELPVCALGCALCLCIIALFSFLRKRVGRQGEPEPLLRRGCALLGALLSGDGTAAALSKLAADYARGIYPDVHKQNGVLGRGQSWRLGLLLCLEQLGAMAEGGPPPDAAARPYFRALSALFTAAGADWDGHGGHALAGALGGFLDAHSLPAPGRRDGEWRIALTRVREGLEHDGARASLRAPVWEGFCYRLRQLRHALTLQSGQFRFALKAAILNAACFAACYFIPFARSVWLPMTVFSMQAVFHRDEKRSAAARLLGTMLGMVVFLLVTEFLPGPPTTKSLVLLFVGYSLIFSVTDQRLMMLIGTQMSVQALWPRTMGMGQALGMRLLFILLAAAVVWFGGQLIFRTEKHDAVHYHLRSLLYAFEVMLQRLARFLDEGVPVRCAMELLLRAQLLTGALEKLSADPEIPQREVLRDTVLPSCRAFRLEMTHALLLCHRSDLSDAARAYFRGEVRTLTEELAGIRAGIPA